MIQGEIRNETIRNSMMVLVMLFGLMGCASNSEPSEPSVAPATVQGESSQPRYKEQNVSHPEGQVFYSTYDANGNPLVYLFDT